MLAHAFDAFAHVVQRRRRGEFLQQDAHAAQVGLYVRIAARQRAHAHALRQRVAGDRLKLALGRVGRVAHAGVGDRLGDVQHVAEDGLDRSADRVAVLNQRSHAKAGGLAVARPVAHGGDLGVFEQGKVHVRRRVVAAAGGALGGLGFRFFFQPRRLGVVGKGRKPLAGLGQRHALAFGEVEGHLGARAELDVEEVLPAEDDHRQARDDQHQTQRQKQIPQGGPVDVGLEQAVQRRPHGGQLSNLLGLGDPLIDLDDHAGGKQRGEERGDDADAQHDGEALDLGRGGVAQHEAGDQGGDVGVENGRQRLAKALADRRAEFRPGVLLFADALEDQHVGVHRHADGQHQPRDARQREGRLDHGHDAQDDDHVRQQREVGHQAGEEVVDRHEDRHGDQRHHAGPQAFTQVVGAQGRAGGLLRDRVGRELTLERAGSQRADEVL